MLYWIRRHLMHIHCVALLLAGGFILQTIHHASQLWIPEAWAKTMVPITALAVEASKKRVHPVLFGQINLFAPVQQPQIHPTATSQPTSRSQAYKLCDPKAHYRPSQMRWELKGTTVADEPSYSTASLYIPALQDTIVLHAGESYRGVRLCQIKSGVVRLDRGQGRFERLDSTMSHSPLRKHRQRARLLSLYRGTPSNSSSSRNSPNQRGWSEYKTRKHARVVYYYMLRLRRSSPSGYRRLRRVYERSMRRLRRSSPSGYRKELRCHQQRQRSMESPGC